MSATRRRWWVWPMAAVGLVWACADRPANPPRGEWIEPVTGMVFRAVPAGRFVMGSPPDEADREDQERPHEVELSRPFWIGAYEVTQAEWQSVMGSNPSRFAGSGRLPVEQVTGHDAHTFLARLTAQSTGDRFRLPTEAEWEYACRAGTSTPFSAGKVLTREQANVAVTPESAADGRTAPVGSYAPNPWGLYDMHGNVWEWTADEHCPYAAVPVIDPRAACGAALHVIRGGSWRFLADSARCALRYTHALEDRGPSLGFRVVREAAASR